MNSVRSDIRWDDSLGNDRPSYYTGTFERTRRLLEDLLKLI